MIPFGPRLMGQTEKALNRVLQRILEHHDLGEPQWVTLRLAQDRRPAGSLADFVAGEGQYPYAVGIIAGLHARGLLRDDALTEEGRLLVARVSATVDHQVGRHPGRPGDQRRACAQPPPERMSTARGR
ncbi:hypothetical protein [Arsenicicoccus bolidensis]|uniref:hypothetical protein n=1 Tax=Arsenicicoccus bolidensis TaxID=229480 RepID=UPI0028B25548|nr:hypothetical protein [Arsenicicoccus bolidensis]